MAEAHTDGCIRGTIAAAFLSFAAAPTFAIMALLTVVLGGGPLDALCSAAHGASPLTGMVPMYVLMSAFHSAPWLKLINSRRSNAPRGRHSHQCRTLAVPNRVVSHED